MATTAYIPVEEYLRSSYEPDAEYVDGEIEERPAAEYSHAAWHAAIMRWFFLHEDEWRVDALPSLRTKVSPTRIRVPDISVQATDEYIERIATRPPIAVFEILSPEDTVHRMRRKLADYAKMGIPQIWVIDPEDGASLRYVDGELLRGEVFEEPSLGISFRIEEIGKLVRR
jgi:Uma2 family endonuclease